MFAPLRGEAAFRACHDDATRASCDRMSITAQVTSYVLTAMLSWVPLRNQIERTHDGRWVHDSHGYYVTEDANEARARYEQIASDITSIALDEKNPALFKGEDGRLKTALALASIASFEGGYHKWVENGDCNSSEFQALEKDRSWRECDGGAAWSNWQIHMYGYVIRNGELTQAQYLENSLAAEDREWMKAHKDEIIHGKDLAADPKLAAQIAYYLVRYSTRNFKTLCSYTGEDCDGRQPKAHERLARAIDYLKAHPFVPEAEVSQSVVDRQIFEIIALGLRRPSPLVLRTFAAQAGPFAMRMPQIQLN